jgi:hypothetical protein
MAKKLDPKVAEKVMLKAGLKPLEPFNKASYKWKSIHIQCGDIVYPTYSSIKRGRGGCTPCGQLRSINAQRTPEKVAVAIMLKAGMKPLEPYKNALSRWKCQCLTCGHIGHPQLSTIKSGNGGCRPCSYIKTGLAFRISEKESRSRLKKQKLQYVGKYKWVDKRTYFKIKCLNCKSISETNWDNLGKLGRNTGCEFCSRSKAMFQQVTEEDHNKILAQHNLEPFGKYTGNQDLITVKCLLCNKRKPIRRAFLLQRSNKMQGCMTCAGARIADLNEIAKVMKKAKLEPLVPYKNSDNKWKCKCLKCGEIVYPMYGSIQQGQGGCIPCGIVSLGNAKRTPEGKAVAVMLKNNLRPLEPYVNMNLPWKCRCLKCKRVVRPNLGNITSGHTGCIYCAPAGLNMTKDSYIYLITNKELNAHKIGIGNVKKNMDRLGRFNSRGWETHKVWNFQTGRAALDLEKQIFKVIRKELKIPVHLSYEQMKSTGGHIETVNADSITLLELEKIIKKVIRSH